MGMYGTSSGSDPRVEEKAEMIQVNEKLENYIKRVRGLRDGDAGTNIFLEISRNMENDLKKMKALYENELEKNRRKLDEANQQKNMALSENGKNQRAAKDFEDRFRAESDKNRKLLSDINELQKKIADLEREITNLKSSARGPQSLLSTMQDDLNREKSKNKQLANDLDHEKNKNKQLEDRVKTLDEKNKFSDQLSNEQAKDTNKRVDEAKKVISDLEKKNRDLEKQVANLPEVLRQMKQKTDQEIQQYKNDIENSNRKNNDTIRKQLNDQGRVIEQLRADNAKLEKENQDLMTRLRSMDAQIKDLNNQKAALEEQIRLERSKAQEQHRALERKLKELQDLLIEKMNEVNANRDVQVSLRTEIAHAKALLEEEEARLRAAQNNDTGNYGRGNLSSAASSLNSGRLESSYSDRKGADKTKMTNGRKDPRTEYQSAYNKQGRYAFANYGRGKQGGLPTLATGRGNSGTGAMRYSMPN